MIKFKCLLRECFSLSNEKHWCPVCPLKIHEAIFRYLSGQTIWNPKNSVRIPNIWVNICRQNLPNTKVYYPLNCIWHFEQKTRTALHVACKCQFRWCMWRDRWRLGSTSSVQVKHMQLTKYVLKLHGDRNKLFQAVSTRFYEIILYPFPISSNIT